MANGGRDTVAPSPERAQRIPGQRVKVAVFNRNVPALTRLYPLKLAEFVTWFFNNVIPIKGRVSGDGHKLTPAVTFETRLDWSQNRQNIVILLALTQAGIISPKIVSERE